MLASSSQGVKDEAWLSSLPLSLWALGGSLPRICSARSCDIEQSKSLLVILLLDLCISTLLWFLRNCISEQTRKAPPSSLCADTNYSAVNYSVAKPL